MASGPITSWRTDGETEADFIFWAPKSLQMVIAAIKLKDACLLLGTKVAANRDNLFKSRDITLVCLVKAMVFPVVMYGYNKQSHLPLHQKEYIEINLRKEEKDLYSENYKILIKEIEDDTNRHRLAR